MTAAPSPTLATPAIFASLVKTATSVQEVAACLRNPDRNFNFKGGDNFAVFIADLLQGLMLHSAELALLTGKLQENSARLAELAKTRSADAFLELPASEKKLWFACLMRESAERQKTEEAYAELNAEYQLVLRELHQALQKGRL